MRQRVILLCVIAVSMTFGLAWVETGFCLRMSNPDAGIIATSLIESGASYRAVVRDDS